MFYPNVESCTGVENFICGPSHEFGPDGDIAGVGVLYAFMAAALLTLLVTIVSVVIEAFQYFGSGADKKTARSYKRFSDAFLVSLGDTQIITSLALLISTNAFVGCSISAYHLNLVCNLVLISSASHIGSMAVIHKYFGQKWYLGIIRCALTMVNLAFAWVLYSHRLSSSIFPSFKPDSNIPHNGTLSTGLTLPAACYFGHPNAPDSGNAKNFTSSPLWFPWMSNATSPSVSNGTLAGDSSPFGNSSSFKLGSNVTWPLFEQFSSNDHLTNVGDVVALSFLTVSFVAAIGTSIWMSVSEIPRNHIHKVAYAIRFISAIINYSLMIYGISQFFKLQNWMKESNLFKGDDSEANVSSFGQLMPIVLLALPVLALLEQFAASDSSPEKSEDQVSLNSMNSNTYP